MSQFNLNPNNEPRSDLSLAGEFLELIPRAMREIRSELRNHRKVDLSVPQFRIMAQLSRGPRTNKDLAESVGVSVTTMSRMVHHMVELGYLEKAEGAKDRRELRIRLSRVGRSLFNGTVQETRKGLAIRVAKLSSADKRRLRQGFAALARALIGTT